MKYEELSKRQKGLARLITTREVNVAEKEQAKEEEREPLYYDKHDAYIDELLKESEWQFVDDCDDDGTYYGKQFVRIR